MDTKGWTSEAPTNDRLYWLFGWVYASERKTSSPAFHKVNVWEISNGFVYVCEGNFFDPRKCYGVWREIETPPLPPMVMNSEKKRNYKFEEEELFFVEFDTEVFPDLKIP